MLETDEVPECGTGEPYCAAARINADVEAPVTGLPVAVFYSAGVVFSVSAGVLLLYQLWLALSGQLSDDELVMIRESEEEAELDALKAELAREAAAEAAQNAPQGAPQGAAKAQHNPKDRP